MSSVTIHCQLQKENSHWIQKAPSFYFLIKVFVVR